MRTGIRILLWLSLAALLLCTVAASPVTGETVIAKAGEEIRIPLCVTQNKGIMGFRITVDYPAELLCSPRVGPGSLTGTGLLDSNISQEGHIDIVWCGSSDVQGDGSLFVLEFMVREGAQGTRGELLLSYTQEDTFNEHWEDVVLELSPVYVTVQNSGHSEINTQATDSISTSEDPSPTSQTIAATTDREEPPTASEEAPQVTMTESTLSVSEPGETTTILQPQWTEAPAHTSRNSTTVQETFPEPPTEQEEPMLLVPFLCLAAVVAVGMIFGLLSKRRK